MIRQISFLRVTFIFCVDIKAGSLHLQFKEGPVRESGERDDHISPENEYVGAFRQIHITQRHEGGRLEKEQQSHLRKPAGQSHQTDDESPKTEYSIHACHVISPFLHANL